MRRRLIFLLPILMLAATIALRVADPWPIEQLRLLVFDSYQRAKPRTFDVNASSVRIIDIDDESLKRIGQWPWPRSYLAKMVEALTAMGAGAIAFDVIFPEPDASSPEQAVKRWFRTKELEPVIRAAAKLPSHDKQFAAAIAKSRVVTAFALDTGRPNKDVPRHKAGFAFQGDNPGPYLPAFRSATLTLPALVEAARGNGSIAFVPDRDLVIRRVPLFVRLRSEIYPVLGLEALRVATQSPSFLIRSTGASGELGRGQGGIVSARIGSPDPRFRYTIPTDAQGRLVMYYTPSMRERYIPAWKLFAGQVKPAEIAGQILLVGTSAAGLKDLRSTTLEGAVPGVEIQAQLIEQIMTGTFLLRPDYITGVELFFIALVGAIVLYLLPRVGAVWTGTLGVLAVGSAIGISWLAFDRAGWLIDPVYPSIAVVLVVLVGTVVVYLRSEAERRQVRGAFSRYMSPELVRQLAESPKRLVLGGENRDMTILFCDIRGFTAISETFDDASELTRFINEFLTPMTEVILDRRGTIDKYMGDAIMAFWNAPLDDPDHARNGCRAALAMTAALTDLNAERAAEAEARGTRFLPVKIGIGLNTGTACVGNLGSEQRFDYSVIGDEVNLASRLEGQCKTYAVDTVVGENTQSAAPDFAMLEIDLIRVVGRAQPARIYTIVGDEAHARDPAFQMLTERHGGMLEAYRGRQWAKALRLVDQCRELQEARVSGFYDVLEARIKDYRKHPPPKDWDGVYDATSK